MHDVDAAATSDGLGADLERGLGDGTEEIKGEADYLHLAVIDMALNRVSEEGRRGPAVQGVCRPRAGCRGGGQECVTVTREDRVYQR
jgi:hypothetical protein